MNLHGIVSGAIGAVNPQRKFTVQISAGYTSSADGTQVPVYLKSITLMGQAQPMSWKDLQQTDGLNLQGTVQSIYFTGRIEGIVRADRKGGDLVTDDQGKIWLVETVLEEWPDWCKVAVTLQNQS